MRTPSSATDIRRGGRRKGKEKERIRNRERVEERSLLRSPTSLPRHFNNIYPTSLSLSQYFFSTLFIPISIPFLSFFPHISFQNHPPEHPACFLCSFLFSHKEPLRFFPSYFPPCFPLSPFILFHLSLSLLPLSSLSFLFFLLSLFRSGESQTTN